MAKENMVGKRLSFLELLASHHIQIPIIQRDYAQGRPTQSELRSNFLDKLHGYLTGTDLERDLDFIYGNTKKEEGILKFIPLDGQQRLTTLMLLHWYLSLRAERYQHFSSYALDINNRDGYICSRFSYQTRTSSKDFCNKLFQFQPNLTELLANDQGKQNSLSKTIRNAHWFALSWNNDPTVKGMLNMLDAIHQRFYSGTESFYDRLSDTHKRVITFLFLDLDKHNLSDDLYIKMNARGVTLSTFENFKANFEQYLSGVSPLKGREFLLDFEGEQIPVGIKTYYAHQLDTQWSGIFWNLSDHHPDRYDSYLNNLIRTLAISTYADASIESDKQQEKILDKLLSEPSAMSFYQYNQIGLFKGPEENPLHAADERLLDELITYLDVIKARPGPKSHYANGHRFDENQILRSLLSSNYKVAEYGTRLKFYAYYKFLITYLPNPNLQSYPALAQWLRVVYNLVESSLPYDRLSGFLSAVRSINSLLPYAQNILEGIANQTHNLPGFDDYQWREERLKAKLMLMDQEWHSLILESESHAYFNGQIGFLLFLCGLKEEEALDTAAISQATNMQAKIAFKSYYNKAKQVFWKNGIKESLSNNGQYIWERALLSIGNYTLKESQNDSFLIGLDRDISWKRFFKLDKGEAGSRKHLYILKTLFDELNEHDIPGSLEGIRTNHSSTGNWRERFINNPALFGYLGGKRYFRKSTGHGFVLFKGERMSGGHAELISYDFHTRISPEIDITPFRRRGYYSAAGEERYDRPCAFIDTWIYQNIHFALDIFGEKDGRLLIRFFCRDQGHFPATITELILGHGFDPNELPGSFLLRVVESEIQDQLIAVCTDFLDLQDQQQQQNKPIPAITITSESSVQSFEQN